MDARRRPLIAIERHVPDDAHCSPSRDDLRLDLDDERSLDVTFTLVDLCGAVALLLWGVHMVQTGIQRAFGPGLRRLLSVALASRFKGFLAGLGVTAILQSSTATGLMVASFAAGGLVDLVPALAAMLGANVGTTLIVQVLAFDVSRIAALAVLIGVMMFRRSSQTRTRDLGRVAIGLGLMLMALHQLLGLVTPFEDVPSLRLLLGGIATEPLIAIVVAAAFTWAAHSSVAVVLLVMSFAAKGVVPPDAAFALVLGANLGSAINPFLEGASGEGGIGRRLPLGNLLNRAVGCALALATLGWVGRWLVLLVDDPAREVAVFHTGFNLVLAVLFFPILGPFARLLRQWLPARVTPTDPSQPLYLGAAEQEAPTVALAGAAREALRMSDVLETMLRGAWDVLARDDRRLAAETRRLDDVLGRLDVAIKTYTTALDPDGLSEADHRRLVQILAFTTNIEHAGDVLDRGVMVLAAKRSRRGMVFTADEQAELGAAMERLLANLRAAAAVFMTEDARAARQLVAEKEVFREIETRATAAHIARFRDGRGNAVEATTLHLDLLRSFKSINAHLIGAAAYPVLEAQGALLPSRLRDDLP